MEAAPALNEKLHAKFWQLHLSGLPQPYMSADHQRFVV